jgi:hypothetical protein
VGGGFYSDGFPDAGTLVLTNSIVAGNVDTSSDLSDDIFGSVNVARSRFNLIGTAGSGGLIDGVNGNKVGVADPELAPLGDYGGPTQTMALLSGSPAIGAGDASLLPADAFDLDGDGNTAEPLPVDQRCLPRVVGGTLDIGAYEYPA